MKKYLPIATIILITLAIAIGATLYHKTRKAAQSTPKSAKISEGLLSSAEVVIPIDNISRDGKVISLTIPENARDYDEKANAAQISAMKKVSAASPKKCPQISSTAINRSIENYNMISGKAKIKATFTNAEIAKKVEEADCLLIKNEE